MNKPDPGLVRELPQQFDITGANRPGKRLAPQHRVKVFKSGNSLAVRMPKGLGLEAGMELELTDRGGGHYELRRADAGKRKIHVDAFWGTMPDLQPLSREDREFEHSPRPWDDPDWRGWGEGDA